MCLWANRSKPGMASVSLMVCTLSEQTPRGGTRGVFAVSVVVPPDRPLLPYMLGVVHRGQQLVQIRSVAELQLDHPPLPIRVAVYQRRITLE